MSDKIKGVDFDKFVVYAIGSTTKRVVVKMVDAHLIESLSRKHKGIANIPDGETVMTEDLVMDESGYTYAKTSDNLIERKVNELREMWGFLSC
jgi:hypothetical protein